MRLSIKAMHYFLTAVDRCSIVQAAQERNVVPSAISTAIDAVESEFGLKLVQRFPAKGIQPTAAGIIIAQKIRRLIEEYDDLIIGGNELRDALSGKLSIGYYAPMAPAFLPATLAPLMQENPEIRLQCIECNNESAQLGLLDGTFDVIVFVSDKVHLGVSCDTLIEAPPYLLLPPTHPLAKRRSVSFTELAGLDMVLLDLPFTTAYLRGLFDEVDIEPQVVATASSSEMVRNLVGAGVGCSILNMRPLGGATHSGKPVVEIPIRPPVQSLRLVLGHLDGNPRRVVSAVRESILAYFGTPEARKLIVANSGRTRRRVISGEASDGLE